MGVDNIGVIARGITEEDVKSEGGKTDPPAPPEEAAHRAMIAAFRRRFILLSKLVRVKLLAVVREVCCGTVVVGNRFEGNGISAGEGSAFRGIPRGNNSELSGMMPLMFWVLEVVGVGPSCCCVVDLANRSRAIASFSPIVQIGGDESAVWP